MKEENDTNHDNINIYITLSVIYGLCSCLSHNNFTVATPLQVESLTRVFTETKHENKQMPANVEMVCYYSLKRAIKRRKRRCATILTCKSKLCRCTLCNLPQYVLGQPCPEISKLLNYRGFVKETLQLHLQSITINVTTCLS